MEVIQAMDRGKGMAVAPELFQDPAPESECAMGTLKRGNWGLTAGVGLSCFQKIGDVSLCKPAARLSNS